MDMCLIVTIELKQGMLAVRFFPSGIHEWLSCDQLCLVSMIFFFFYLNYWILAKVQLSI